MAVQIMVASTTLCLVAGRFGLAPTVGKRASAGLKLGKVESDIMSSDPSGAIEIPIDQGISFAIDMFCFCMLNIIYDLHVLMMP